MTAAGTSSWRTRRDARQAAAADGPGRLPERAPRRWPWALLAAALGAAGGAALAALARQQVRADAPGAQEPHELRAVVDRPAPDPAG